VKCLEKNLKEFLLRAAIVVALVYISRMLFQFPIEYYSIEAFRQNAANRLFSKIDALKVLTLVGLFFGLYYRKKISRLAHSKFRALPAIIYIVLAELFIAAYYLMRAGITVAGPGVWQYVLSLGILIALLMAFLFSCAAVFGRGYLTRFYSEFRLPLVGAAAISAVMYFVLMEFQKQWRIFSESISQILYWLLSQSYYVEFMQSESGPILALDQLSVAIGPPCSGIDSMLLFFSFFVGIYALDHKRLHKARFFVLALIGLSGTYIINVLRLYLLLLVGIHISPSFAVGLFHTNAGWVFFLLYFFTYFIVIRKFIYHDRTTYQDD